MSTDNSTPQPVLSDQIARDYLRDRDTACPRCDYSLRGSNSSTCPECGCAFNLLASDPENPDDFQRLIRFGILVLTLIALISVIGRVMSIVQIVVFGGRGLSSVGMYGFVYITGLVLWPLFFIFLLTRWIKAKRGIRMQRRSFVVPAIIMLVMFGVPALINVVWSIYLILTLNN